ncbi:ferredoxin [Stackebrandtia endophytica]|uniref:Ferredoxin n=1 Tax=Stackebrandtia endophytica TaxID=1496996 RepID=A0A543B3L4_9ACTN|nr:ferredoxin [Stackebrandtia endophytica]TQL79416.1 ferredoxin [Stackebrandtia endophytica]
MRIRLDEEKCCGSGQCVLSAPGVFDQRDEDGTSVLLRPYPDPDQYQSARDAALVCPGRAISIEP